MFWLFAHLVTVVAGAVLALVAVRMSPSEKIDDD